MDKDSAKKTMNCGSPALKRDQDLNTSTSEQSSASGNPNRTIRPPNATFRFNPSRNAKSDDRTSSDECGLTEVTEKVREDVEASTLEDSESCNTSVEDVSKRGNKRKAVAGAEGPEKSRLDLKEASGPTETEHTQRGLSVHGTTAEFEAKYQQQDLLGEGGCGSVFAGYRKADNLPVAIKHVPNDNILCQRKGISAEVTVMSKLAAKSEGTSAPVSLLDHYKLDQELILVLERPIPAKDLLDHINANGGPLDEEEAKVILKQLIDAAIDLEDKHVFHRDIKPENILIETSSDIPRVRLIDFGLSCLAKKTSTYRVFFGTHIPPEYHDRGFYSAGPTTVFQMGVVLFEMLHTDIFVMNRFFRNNQRISNKLSENCQDFFRTSLNRDPNRRSTLKQLRSHPWLC
ncbi:serine/threonine-protein kinase pim-1-like [Anarhichas minor]|uniref:serine/threonine-protein kinase pim-1-like n=1 Tax=Anarhichas minor TaxID=65739 RepID=UPI003F733B86